MTASGEDIRDSHQIWNEFQFTSAQNFISNVVFIDDRPWVEAIDQIDSPPETIEKDDTEDTAMGRESEDSDPLPLQDNNHLPFPSPDQHYLRIKDLISSFADKEISASFLFPSPADEENNVVEQAHKLSKIADIVVIDWYLKNERSDLTSRIVKDLVSAYQRGEWRTRLVCIYTGVDVAALPDALTAQISAEFGEEVCVKNDDNSLSIGEDVRIIFLNKEDIPPSQLPAKLISSFSKISDGLLPTFALNSVAALRRNTHHLLSAFSKELDPAIVGHRMYLSDSDDAELFGLDVLVMQLRSILSTNIIHRKALSLERFENWIHVHCPEPRAVDGKALECQELVELMGVCYSTKLDQQPTKKTRKKWEKSARHAVYSDSNHLRDVTSKMGRLSKLVREYGGKMPLPNAWRPTLGLGAILRSDEDGGYKYWLCVQPLCDSVRLDGDRFFPLLKLVRKSEGERENEDVNKYWLAVTEGKGVAVLSLRANPKDGDFIKFSPEAKSKRVLAEKQADGRFIFSSLPIGDKPKIFEWVADVEPLQAQRAVAEMTAQLNRVGVDEYEGLRRGLPF